MNLVEGLGKNEFFAVRFPDSEKLHNFYQSKVQMRMCGHEEKDMLRVRLEESLEGTYWGWLYSDKDEFNMIFYHPSLVEMCFPYGTAILVERGEGRMVQLKATILFDSKE